VDLVDERYSTVEARARRHGAQRLATTGAPAAAVDRAPAHDDDAAAAAVILEQYLGGLGR